MSKGLMLALVAGAVLGACAWLGRKQSNRPLAVSPKHKEALDRWEGEGGNPAPRRLANAATNAATNGTTNATTNGAAIVSAS